MFGKRIPLFNLFGFKVGIDPTWIILAVLITWSLAKGVFPRYFHGLSNVTYWYMGAAGALGLFVSIVFHEFCHSIVARRFGLPMKGITLFIFGGVSEMEAEPESPKAEFYIAVVGPISSVALCVIFYLVNMAGQAIGWPESVRGILGYLAWINLILAIFNLIPAFPLDGGRVLRSILWRVKGNLNWSTRIASVLGSGIGLFLMILGILSFITESFIIGIWYFLIGMFIRSSAQMSYKQLLIRKALGGEHIIRFMKADPITVSPSLPIEQLVNEYFYRYHFRMFPVSDDGHLIGCVSSKQIKELPKQEWARFTARDVASPCSKDNTVSPDTDAMEALSLMNRTGNSRLMVVDAGRLVGIITLKDMLKLLALKLDLEES